MARVNVYLPDALAREARRAGLNVSSVTQVAIRAALARTETERWLDQLEVEPRREISHARVLTAIDEAREELGR